jgi:signal transduction histidine kinase
MRLVAAFVIVSLVAPRAWPSGTLIAVLLTYLSYSLVAYLAIRRGRLTGVAGSTALNLVDLAAPLALVVFVSVRGLPRAFTEAVDGLLIAGSLLTVAGVLERRRAARETVSGGLPEESVRSDAARDERAAIAREIHDGPIQSLIGADMSLEALKRHARLDGTATGFEVGIADAQRILRQEISGLRELMIRMRPVDVPPGGLPAYLARAVGRFSRESGIRAEFVVDDRSAAVLLPRHEAIGLWRIAHEALINVRKHSAATRVIVSLLQDADATVSSFRTTAGASTPDSPGRPGAD